METATWSLGGVPIYVEKDTTNYSKPRIGEINILDSEHRTIAHFAGTEAPKRDITFVMFSGYYNLFEPMVNGSGYELISDQGSEGTYKILDSKPERLQDIRRTCEVHRVKLQLIKVSGV